MIPLRLPLGANYATQRMLVPQAGLVVLPPCQAGTPSKAGWRLEWQKQQPENARSPG